MKKERPLRVLTICAAGTVRSVALAHVLKFGHGIDAVPVGQGTNSRETIGLLSDWADVIVPMQPAYAECVPPKHARKILPGVDVGLDVWGNPLNTYLLRKCEQIAREIVIRTST